MAVGVAEIDAAATVPVVELTIVDAPRGAAIGQLRLANAPEDGIELVIADMERVVVTLEFLGVVEQERERVVETDRREMPVLRIGLETENAGKKLRRRPLVAGRGRWCG